MMTLRDLVIGTLLVCAVILGSTTFYTSIYSEYGINETGQNATYIAQDTISKINQNTINMTASLNQTSPDVTTTTEWNVWSGVWNAFMLLGNMPSIIISLVTGTYNLVASFGIPMWSLTIATSIIALFVAFEIISAVLKYRT